MIVARAVLVSSHLMSELGGTADHLVIVGRGKVIADTNTRDLRIGLPFPCGQSRRGMAGRSGVLPRS
jgi:ABC-type multidrug transport system ATPase subunit